VWNQNLKLGKSAFLEEYFVEKNIKTLLRWCGGKFSSDWSFCHGITPRKQEDYLPQTDCTSAFVVDSEKIFVTCSLITMQNLVIIIM